MIKILPYIIAVVIPIIINLILTPILLKIAHNYRWYDEIDHRKIHTGNIPRIGGMGIAFSFASTIIIIKFFQTSFSPDITGFIPVSVFWAVVLGSIIINLIGLLDDFSNLRPLYKLIGQFAAAIVVVISGRYFSEFYIPFFDITIELGIFSYFLTIIWIVGITNAINLIDGMDGLSGGVTSIIIFFMAFSALISNNLTQSMLLFMLFGSVISFVIFNFPPAKLFMGDSGSLFLGFFLACMPLYTFTKELSAYSLILSISFLLIPIIDTLSAIIRRKIRGVPFHSPDMDHIHHKLLKIGLSTKKVLLVFYFFTIIFSFVPFIYIYTRNILFIYIIILLWIVALILVYLLNLRTRKKS